VLGIVNSEIVKVTDENIQKEIYISFWTLSSVTFTISLLTIPNTSVLISISFCTLSSVTFTIECTEKNKYQYRSVRDS
jgi:MFS-type transporter involved in bile tolerance (Atg22 family)